MPIFQLLTFTHYYFLLATSMLMRCHLSEAFGCARIAIDATLIGAHLIGNRSDHVAYTNRTKPFDNFARHLGNLIRDGKPLPHPLVPELVRLQKRLSTFTSHADIGAFVHRVDITREESVRQIRVQYFQYSETTAERQIHALTLFHIFVMVLDVFSEFLALEHKIVRKEWQFEVIRIGTELEREVARLKTTLPARWSTIPRIRHRRSEALKGELRRLGCGSGAGPICKNTLRYGMTTESPDQIRANYIAVMGPSLGAEFHELMQDAARLHLKWNEFKAIYSAGTEKIELLNKTAPGFFWLAQNAWWHDIVLHIFRMSDDDRKVLSILKLKVPSALVDEFKVKVHALKAATKFAHKLRNEYIAHRNREVALQARPIPDSSLQQVQTAIAAIDDALHVVDQHFTKRLPSMYDHLDIRGGSKSLLWIVRRGLVARDDDISHHRPMMRFTE